MTFPYHSARKPKDDAMLIVGTLSLRQVGLWPSTFNTREHSLI